MASTYNRLALIDGVGQSIHVYNMRVVYFITEKEYDQESWKDRTVHTWPFNVKARSELEAKCRAFEKVAACSNVVQIKSIEILGVRNA